AHTHSFKLCLRVLLQHRLDMLIADITEPVQAEIDVRCPLISTKPVFTHVRRALRQRFNPLDRGLPTKFKHQRYTATNDEADQHAKTNPDHATCPLRSSACLRQASRAIQVQ